MSLSGVPSVGTPVPHAFSGGGSGGGAVIAESTRSPDFGPAAVFTPSTFEAASVLTLYNNAGISVPLTHWLRTGTVPVVGDQQGTDQISTG